MKRTFPNLDLSTVEVDESILSLSQEDIDHLNGLLDEATEWGFNNLSKTYGEAVATKMLPFINKEQAMQLLVFGLSERLKVSIQDLAYKKDIERMFGKKQD